MIRVVFENIAIFLIPTLLYAAYVLLTVRASDDQMAERTVSRVMHEAPLLWLFTAGAILVVLTLIAFRGSEGGRPGETYQAPVYRDGHIQPSQVNK
jgi:hypothetical protein